MRKLHQKKQINQNPLLGIDWGIRFCGFSYSLDGSCVFPLKVVERKNINSYLKEIINDKKIKKIVIGIPISPNSQENKVCKNIREFAKKIKNDFKLEVVFQNEKFSTKEGLKLKTKKEKRADHLAAVKILEYYLE